VNTDQIGEAVREEKTKTKAIALLSGGLDSTLAVRLMLDQGIHVEALNFVTPFCTCDRGGDGCAARRAADEAGIRCKTVAVTDELFDAIRDPKHGYGSEMNPCLDCRILMFSKARDRMEETEAAFVFTGEVLGQRPMSQRSAAMRIIDIESGLEDRVLRPLSAQHLEPTVVEEEGLVDRSRLLALQGRSRGPQMSLAKTYGVTDYPCPAGGCRLTDPNFARRMRDLLEFDRDFGINDVNLLKVGRHFRLSAKAKAVAGRDEDENHRILGLAQEEDLLFEVKGCGSPVTLLRGSSDEGVIRLAAAITARYSDAEANDVRVHFGRTNERLDRSVVVPPADQDTLADLRL
jgi:tRNA U34 2-thiouridine synthase MnmA/TrmU